MKKESLSEHTFKKGKFITALHSLPMMQELPDVQSWMYGRMPEYLWIGLILKFFGRDEGLRIMYGIIKELHRVAPKLKTVRLSQILKLDASVQKSIYDTIVFYGAEEALEPLTIILTVINAPVFNKYFYSSEMSYEDRCDALTDAMQGILDHQSESATDIRFIVLYFSLLTNSLVMQKEQIDLILQYPRKAHSDEIMRMIRPSVRAAEQMILNFMDPDLEYLEQFWRYLSEMTDCSLFSLVTPPEKRDIADYMDKLHNSLNYFVGLFEAANPLDEKMLVLLGISVYSYKRFKEICDNNMYNSIAGRSCIRSLIENYIMMKYLLANESTHENIWREYQLYGIGAYKLVMCRYRESDNDIDSHVNPRLLEAYVNEFRPEEMIDMDTNYFNKDNIRKKAESVGEKDLYGLYYDYGSSYEHGLWGAIRESSMLKCENPAHQLHCVPDLDCNVSLSSVLSDCIMIMNKTVAVLNDVYGMPEGLFNEVTNYELKHVD